MHLSYLQDHATWTLPETTGWMKCAPAKYIALVRYNDRTDIVATTEDGKEYQETIGVDGPLPALGRLSMKIRNDRAFGKRRREFRTKQRSLKARMP